MARFPDKFANPRAPLRGDPGADVDTDEGAIGRGLQSLAGGVSSFGRAQAAEENTLQRSRLALDLSRREAAALKQYRAHREEIEQRVSQEPDFQSPEEAIDFEPVNVAREFGTAADQTIERLTENIEDETRRNEVTTRLTRLRAPFEAKIAATQHARETRLSQLAVDQVATEAVAQIFRDPDLFKDMAATALEAIRDPDARFTPEERLAAQNAFHRAAVKAAVQGEIERNPKYAKAILDRGHLLEDGGFELTKFLTADDLKGLKETAERKFDADLKRDAEAAAVDLMRSGSFVAAASRVATGDLQGTVLGAVLDRAPKDKRAALTKSAINAVRAQFGLMNDIEQAQDRRSQKASDRLRAMFYETDDPDRRGEILATIKLLGAETPEKVETLEAIHNNRSAFAPQNNDEAEVHLRRDIQEGRSGMEDIESLRHTLDKRAFTAAVSLWGSVQNDAVRDAMRFIDRELGVPSGMLVFNDETLRLAQKADTVKNRLQTWLEQNPDASAAAIREQRDQVLKDARKAVIEDIGEAALERLNRLGSTIPGFDVDNPEASLTRLLQGGELAVDDPRVLQLKRAIAEARRHGKIKGAAPPPADRDPRAGSVDIQLQ